MTSYTHHESPLGRLLLIGDEEGLRRVHLDEADPWPVRAEWREDRDAFLDLCRQLDEYFAGTRRTFDVRLAPGGTAFQQAVWRALLRVPFGRTRTYAGLAADLGLPRSARAVGAACGANPIAILIPCHRVLGSDGKLTGYAGGFARKEALLRLEGWEPICARSSSPGVESAARRDPLLGVPLERG